MVADMPVSSDIPSGLDYLCVLSACKWLKFLIMFAYTLTVSLILSVRGSITILSHPQLKQLL